MKLSKLVIGTIAARNCNRLHPCVVAAGDVGFVLSQIHDAVKKQPTIAQEIEEVGMFS